MQVNPSPALNPCLSPSELVAVKLKSFVFGEGNHLDGFLRKGEIKQAVQLALSVLKSTSDETDCGQALDPDAKALVRHYRFKISRKSHIRDEINRNKVIFTLILTRSGKIVG